MSFSLNNFSKTGLGLIASNLLFPIPSIIIYAMVASFVGEARLESDGELATLGVVLFYLPALVGLALLVYGQFFYDEQLKPKPIDKTIVYWGMVFFGAAMVSTGMVSVVESAGGGDPSVGSGILVLFGFGSMITGAVLLFTNRVKEKKESVDDEKRAARKPKKTSSKK